MPLVVGVIGGLVGLGVLVVVTSWSPAPPARVSGPTDWNRLLRPLAAAAVGGLLGLLLTGWAVAAVGGAVGGYALVRALADRRTTAKAEQARITALAGWCEQLRDLLTAEHGIVGTITATTRTCPARDSPEVERLASRLSRQNPANAIRQFAGELDDPSGDLVASVLLLAMSRSVTH